MKTVGVLGGMGPEATVLFMQRVIGAVQATDDADHVPLLVDQNPQVPSRIAAIIEKTGEDPTPVLRRMARRLEDAGAEALVMPCNTAHHYAPAVRDAVDVPFINMVSLAASEGAKMASGGTIGLLGSPALASVGVFEEPMHKAGLDLLHPIHGPRVLGAIRAIKSNGVTDAIVGELENEANALANAGADAICICCTEFSLVADQLTAPVPVYDALDLLVAATVRFSREGAVPLA